MALTPAWSESWKRVVPYAQVVLCPEGNPYYAKLRLAEIFAGRRVLFVDADCHGVEPFDIDVFQPGAITATPENIIDDPRHFPLRDCETFGINPADYFCGGFFAVDFAEPLVRACFARAIQINTDPTFRAASGDFGEQTGLCLAARDVGLPVRMLGRGYAYAPLSYAVGASHPPRVFSVHAAGVLTERKMDFLDTARRMYHGKHRHPYFGSWLQDPA